MAQSELIKRAKANIARLVQEKQGFTPAAGGAMPPAGAAAPMPADPMAAAGGAPPPDPMAAAGGGAPPPMDAGAMPPGGDPAGGAPIIQIGMGELAQLAEMLQGGGAAAAPGAPAEGASKPKGAGGKNEALELKLDNLMQKIDMLLGFFAAQSGMDIGQLMGGVGAPELGTGEEAGGGQGAEGLIPQLPAGGGGETPPPEGAAPPAPMLQPQAAAKAPEKKDSPAARLHKLVGRLIE
jgi:hypothetical protein